MNQPTIEHILQAVSPRTDPRVSAIVRERDRTTEFETHFRQAGAGTPNAQGPPTPLPPVRPDNTESRSDAALERTTERTTEAVPQAYDRERTTESSDQQQSSQDAESQDHDSDDEATVTTDVAVPSASAVNRSDAVSALPNDEAKEVEEAVAAEEFSDEVLPSGELRARAAEPDAEQPTPAHAAKATDDQSVQAITPAGSDSHGALDSATLEADSASGEAAKTASDATASQEDGIATLDVESAEDESPSQLIQETSEEDKPRSARRSEQRSEANSTDEHAQGASDARRTSCVRPESAISEATGDPRRAGTRKTGEHELKSDAMADAATEDETAARQPRTVVHVKANSAPTTTAASAATSSTPTGDITPRVEPTADSSGQVKRAPADQKEGVLSTFARFDRGGMRGTHRAADGQTTPHVDPARFIHRVARAIHTAQERGGPLHLRLNPPELGAMRLELSVKQGALTANIEADNLVARQILLDNLPALRERLAEQNLRIERFDVDVRREGGDQPNSGPQQQGQRHDAPDSGPTRRARTAPVPTRAAAAEEPAPRRPITDTSINVVA